MTEVIIYYQNEGLVAFNEKEAKRILREGIISRRMSVSDRVERYWTKVYTKEVDGADYYICEKMFMMFNSDDMNPLATKHGQAMLWDLGVKHTSMSTGDIVSIDGRNYLCCMVGFEETR